MVNPLDLTGRVILVTGASSGIGLATSVLLSQLGARIVLVARNKDRLAAALPQLEGTNHQAESFDLATPEGVLDSIRRYPPQTLQSMLTVTVVDPLRFEALYEVLTPLIERQIAGADHIVITKADEAATAEVEAVLRAAGELAPEAPVFVVDSGRPETLHGFLASVALPGAADGGGAGS